MTAHLLRSTPIAHAATQPDRAAAAAAPRDASTLPYPAVQIEAALQRILASGLFRRSLRHRHFLRHVVRAALAAEHDELKEVIIGIEVFGRVLASYDPRTDPVVRVEAGRLRQKLERFYAGEGASEPFEITIPVGGYLPRFVPRPPAAERAEACRSIAVLPFANLSDHPDDAALSIGLANQLIDTLGRMPVLKVVARVSALDAGGRDLPLKTVGKLLGVDHVVEGSLQRSGMRIRCVARLSRVRDGVQLWSQRFDASDAASAELFDFQDRIAAAVLDGVAKALRPAGIAAAPPQSPPSPGPTQNAEARVFFDRARALNLQGSIEGYREAIALLEEATTLDPAFARAHSHLGVTRAMLGPYVFAPTFPNFTKVREAALRALALDPLDGEARALLANHAFRFERDWEGAELQFREALRVAPSSPLVHNYYSWALVFNGRRDEAIRHAAIATALDPLNITLRAHNARLHAYARDYKTAIAEVRAVLERDPHHLYARLVLGIAHLSRGDHEAAMPCFERIARDVPEHSSAHFHMICVWALRGEIAYGRQRLDALLHRLRDTDYTPFNVALAQACLGEREAALAALEITARTYDNLTVSIPYHPLFDRFRDDPDYLALLARHGLKLAPA